ncbi:hypothetical protein IPN41_01130 [Candidatus Falkowbacteria bacterium]|nr:MAG: hypothetical protein IPN41_01130 [Candidatus Falkowbacteria bacterium]
MEAVYYYDPELEYCPVKNYFEQYRNHPQDSPKQKDRNLRMLVDIRGKIDMVILNNGRPIPPISTPLKEYGCIEIHHRKNKDVLIRIIYFRSESKIVLVHSFEKPSNYSSNKERKKIDHEFEIAKKRKLLFISNPTLYEKYE